ncbi:MAG: LysE family translocator [Tsuneonella suprasediminis]
MENLLFLILAAFPLMGSPGPVTMSLAGLGSAFGFRLSLGYLCGVMVGTTAVLLMIATGITVLLLAQPALLAALIVLAGAYILYLAWKIATAPVARAVKATQRPPAFAPGFALAIANPKAFAAIGAVYSGHTVFAGDLTLDMAVKLAALTGVIVISQSAWLAFGAGFSNVLTHPKIGRAANITFAVMLLASVGLTLL